MKEAMGGIFSLQAIFIFVVLMMGLLMFSVSYTKAFKVKNDLVGIVEQYEGFTATAAEKFDSVASRYNYSFNTTGIYANKCTSMGFTPYVRSVNGKEYIVCLQCNLVDSEGTSNSQVLYKGSRYKIATFVNIDIPIIREIFSPITANLMITGETELIYSSGNNTELCKNAQSS